MNCIRIKKRRIGEEFVVSSDLQCGHFQPGSKEVVLKYTHHKSMLCEDRCIHVCQMNQYLIHESIFDP